MNTPNFFDNSGAYPVYLNYDTSATKYRMPDESTARPVDFSCYVYEFALYQEPPNTEPMAVISGSFLVV